MDKGKNMAMRYVNGVLQYVPDQTGGLSADQKSFIAMTPEQQQQIGSAGFTFDSNNKLGLADSATNGTGWWDSLKNSFNPEGTSGRSYAGNVMDTAGTAVGIGTGLAGAYYTKKNYDLQKENQDYLRNREAQNDARKSAFATNAGGGASY